MFEGSALHETLVEVTLSRDKQCFTVMQVSQACIALIEVNNT